MTLEADAVPLSDGDADVVMRELVTSSGHRIGRATLNAEATLNALSLEMIRTLGMQLRRWAADERIVCVFLEGAGARAFAAGGDIRALYGSMRRNHEAGERVDPYAEDFFEAEYRLDHQLHTFPKPVLAWGNGVVMGGGLGLFSASTLKIVTESTRIAMPEITIGLFPDAGATRLLAGMARHQALYLALTGSHMNAADALALGIATHFIDHGRKGEVLNLLREHDWRGQASDADALAPRLSELGATIPLPPSQIEMHDASLRAALGEADQNLTEVATSLSSLAGGGEWIDRGLETFSRGCPTTAGIIVEQIRRAPALDLAASFCLELVIATHCARNAEFAEGIRALIIDKDNRPRWRYASIDDVQWSWVLEHFEPPWAENPLADLTAS